MSKKDKDDNKEEKDSGGAQPTVKQQLVETIRNSESLVITIGKDPDRDVVAAAIALHLMLTKLEKISEVVISSDLHKSLDFLPKDFINKELQGQKDFVIEVDQKRTESDSLKYLREGDKLKIYITPYNGTYSEKDVSFSDGDYHYDLVIGLGASAKAQLDKAVTGDKKVTEKVDFAFINNDSDGGGDLSWSDVAASSVSEMVMSMSEALGGGILDKQIATALLTGIVDKTDHFTNSATTPKVMTMAAQLLAAGANQAEVVKSQRSVQGESKDTSQDSAKAKPEDEPRPETKDEDKKSEAETKDLDKDRDKNKDDSKESAKDTDNKKKNEEKANQEASEQAQPDDTKDGDSNQDSQPEIQGDEPSPDAIADMIKVGSALAGDEDSSVDDQEKQTNSSLIDSKPRERVIEPPQTANESQQELDQQDLESQNILESIKKGGTMPPQQDTSAVNQGLSGVNAAAPSSDAINTFAPGATLSPSNNVPNSNPDSNLSSVPDIENQTLETGNNTAAPFNESAPTPGSVPKDANSQGASQDLSQTEGHIDIEAARKAAEEAYNSMHLDSAEGDNQPPAAS